MLVEQKHWAELRNRLGSDSLVRIRVLHIVFYVRPRHQEEMEILEGKKQKKSSPQQSHRTGVLIIRWRVQKHFYWGREIDVGI